MQTLKVIAILIAVLFLENQQEYTLIQELKYKSDFFTVDQLGNVYVVNDSEIKKIDLKTNQELNYSNSLLGNIYSIDVSDPFKTVVFYKDFNKIVYLDKMLAPISGTISLDDLGYYNVAAICQSVNGGFWLFDQTINELVYVNKSGAVTKTSSQLSELIHQNTDQEQIFMLEKNDYIYLGIKAEGILLFDSYGTYIKTFPLVNTGVFQVNNETISYYNKGSLYFYNTNTFEEKYIELPKKDSRDAMIINKTLFIQTKENILVYTLNNF